MFGGYTKMGDPTSVAEVGPLTISNCLVLPMTIIPKGDSYWDIQATEKCMERSGEGLLREDHRSADGVYLQHHQCYAQKANQLRK